MTDQRKKYNKIQIHTKKKSTLSLKVELNVKHIPKTNLSATSAPATAD